MRNAKAYKRKFVVEDDEDDDTSKIFRFKVLLPNGTSVDVTFRNPAQEIEFRDFIDRVRDEYQIAQRQLESMRKKKMINWSSEQLHLKDSNGAKFRSKFDFGLFIPHKCHILRLHDGTREVMNSFENMWDLTPDTDLLMELPEEYTYETALADLIDNSLQAVWMNSVNERRLISLDVVEDRISIFDTGYGMDDSDKNSIENWGKIGASLSRSSKHAGIGSGKPPYLNPFFGMFGYGGPIASMHLGRHAVVSSKTKESKVVYTLHLEREALLRTKGSETPWKSKGGIRDPTYKEIQKSPHGSFTKVEIFKPKVKVLDISKMQCRLKDIYFPYIQCDEFSMEGGTSTPVEFQVNGINLAEIDGGEVAITNLLSCNGPEFTFNIHFSRKIEDPVNKISGSRSLQEANARLRCIYFPIVKGKERIQRILESLKAEGFESRETYETFSRVSIRRLGRLLPDARWGLLPFMDLRQKKGDKGQLLKRCCLRVKCFIETDGGFNPTTSKTDLAHHGPFTLALKNIGSRVQENDKDLRVEIERSGKSLTPLQLEKEYQDWILQMHDKYDEEIGSGEDQPVLIIEPSNKKALRISQDVVRVHEVLKRRGVSWTRGQKIKVLKGACADAHKNTIFATIDHFLIEGLQGDSGGDARLVCRPLDVAEKDGCVLSVSSENARLDIRRSLSLPISVIDSGKCLAVDNIAWDHQLEKELQKTPSTIDLLSAKHCQSLGIDGALPTDVTVYAGHALPNEIVAVIRPAKCASASKNIDQKDIVKLNLEMSMNVSFKGNAADSEDTHLQSKRTSPSSRKGVDGLYIFPLGSKWPDLFQKAGVYKFSFSIVDSRCKSYEKTLAVVGSREIGEWKLLRDDLSQPYQLSVGSPSQPFSIACYDIFGNRIPFSSLPDLSITLRMRKGFFINVPKMKAKLSSDKMILIIEHVVIITDKLCLMPPNYEAILVVCPKDYSASVSIPCRVIPANLCSITAHPPKLGSKLLPGSHIEQLTLELLDAYGNHVVEGLEVQLKLDGFVVNGQVDSNHKVDNQGRIDLGGLLTVTAGYGKTVSLSVLSDNKVIFKEEFKTEERQLRVASEVPDHCTAGSRLKNLVFEAVNSQGVVDRTIHDDEKSGQFHTLALKSNYFKEESTIRYRFIQGRCVVPSVAIPLLEGPFCFEAYHSRYPELHSSVQVLVSAASKTELDKIESPLSNGKMFLLQHTPSSTLKEVSVDYTPKIDSDEFRSPCSNGKILHLVHPPSALKQDLWEKLKKHLEQIEQCESHTELLDNKKITIEKEMSSLQASLQPDIMSSLDCLLTKDEMIKRIERRGQSAAALVCNLSQESDSQNHLIEDVVSVVALLGTVETNALSRVLAAYLGEDQMLALVCKSNAAADSLEKYQPNGEIDCNHGLHAEAAALGKSINDGFLVLCLEDIRPFSGAFEDTGPSRKLALPHPRIGMGLKPEGFLGYAVNMINPDRQYLGKTFFTGYRLRETLFYRLFGELQVYDTREHMKNARSCTKHGAVSLDGGIFRENGTLYLGYRDPDICFPVDMYIPPVSMEVLRKLDEKKSEAKTCECSIEKLKKLRKKSCKMFNKVKEKVQLLLDVEESMLLKNYDLVQYLPSPKDSQETPPR